ncbi:MAG: ClbS/DfsB family four-helix bundle protein [Planctomycetota bacterium]
MPKPKNKSELLTANESCYAALTSLVDGFTTKQRQTEFPFEHRDRNIRDVLAHLHAWHEMFLAWYEIGMAGEKPVMPAKGYTWKTTPQLNANIWSRYQEISLRKVRSQLERTHSQIRELIESHSDEELFEKRHYPWTGTTSLGAYLVSATSSHYQWATKLLKKFAKSLEQA